MPPDSWKTSFPLAQFLLDNTVSRQFRDLRNDHPLRIAARTYALSLSLSLGPALIPILAEGRLSRKRLARLISASRKELSVTGFAFAMTVAVGGGAALEHYWRRLDHRKTRPSLPGKAEKIALRVESLLHKINLTASRRAFLCNAISSLLAIILMQARRRSSQTRKANIPLTIPITPPEKLLDKKTSATLDLTLLLLVRALDAAFQALFLREAEVRVEDRRSNDEGPGKTSESVRELRKKAAVMTDKLDALVFWAASARIMWCFFYLPRRLPRSYVKWIRTMANVDDRLLEALRRIRAGTWSYGAPASHTLLAPMAEGLGYPSAWADPLQLPPVGGRQADKTWELLGVKGRAGVGGLPCEIVHGNVGSWLVPGGVGGNCFANVLTRGAMGFFEALAIYAPVHFLPIILTGPRKLLSLSLLMKTTLALLRSSLFLSVFISSIWSAICFTRTLAIARLFPHISHNFIDGPFGCILAGCLACGGSIWIEQGKRRGEIALYVLPRALRSLMKDSWLRSGSRSLKTMESLTFVLSLASILTASRHRPETLRGLSRWTVMFVMKGAKGRSSS